MNLLLAPQRWRKPGGSPPPIEWNPDAGAYEVLVADPDGATSAWTIEMVDEAEEGDRIAFTFAVDAFQLTMNDDLELVVYDTVSGSDVVTETISNPPVQGSVEVECEAGKQYSIILGRAGGYVTGFYDLEAVITPDPDPEPELVGYNCACDDDYPRSTLVDMRKRLAVRLGFSVQVSMNALPPGMATLLDDFIRSAQEFLYRQYAVFRMERFFTWDMQAGVRFYDIDGNSDSCEKKLDPRKVTWVGVSQGDDDWRPLWCGIDPVLYSSMAPSIPSHYEIRQCIEVWPAPVDDTWKLRVKGHFGLLPLVDDSDETTIDPEAIFLFALASAKHHYGHGDAERYDTLAQAYVRNLRAGSHHTRRYIPGRQEAKPLPRPVLIPPPPED